MEQSRKSAGRAMLLIAVLLLAIGVWMVASRTTHDSDMKQLAEHVAAVESLAPVNDPTAASTGATSGGARQGNPGEDHEEPSQAEISRIRDEAFRKQESAFLSEPMDASWASAQMANVNAALKPEALAQYGAAAPRNASVDCRSQHCRIVAVYDDMDQAELGQFALASGIGGTLPGTASFMLEQPDGSQRLVIYATAKPSGRPNGH